MTNRLLADHPHYAKDDIPDWALERVWDLSRNSCHPFETVGASREMISAFARYIAQHEKPPVDPLLIEAREIAAAFNHSRGLTGFAEDALKGAHDDQVTVQVALFYLKRKADAQKG